jgi:hypothetical protein
MQHGLRVPSNAPITACPIEAPDHKYIYVLMIWGFDTPIRSYMSGLGYTILLALHNPPTPG